MQRIISSCSRRRMCLRIVLLPNPVSSAIVSTLAWQYPCRISQCRWITPNTIAPVVPAFCTTSSNNGVKPSPRSIMLPASTKAGGGCRCSGTHTLNGPDPGPNRPRLWVVNTHHLIPSLSPSQSSRPRELLLYSVYQVQPAMSRDTTSMPRQETVSALRPCPHRPPPGS